MTASKYIKDQGLKDLQYVADKVGKHRDTINNWYHAEYALFEVVVAGVLAREEAFKKEFPKNMRPGQIVETSRGIYVFNKVPESFNEGSLIGPDEEKIE